MHGMGLRRRRINRHCSYASSKYRSYSHNFLCCVINLVQNKIAQHRSRVQGARRLQQALDHYDRAIAIFRKLERKYFLIDYVIDKADTVFSLQRYEEAQALNAEGLRMAEEIGAWIPAFAGMTKEAGTTSGVIPAKAGIHLPITSEPDI